MIETLESRIAPASVVTFSLKGGLLNLTGSAENDQVEITPLGGGDYLVSGLNGTMLDVGTGLLTATTIIRDQPIVAFKAELGDGADALLVTGLRVLTTTIIKGGDGGDNVVLKNHIGLGAVTIEGGAGHDVINLGGDYFVARSKVSILDGGLGSNVFSIDARSVTMGSLQYVGGAEHDSVAFSALSLRGTQFAFDFGAGSATFTFHGNFATLSSLQVKYGTGPDPQTFLSEVAALTIASGATLLSEGTDTTFTFNGGAVRVGGTLKVTGSGANDRLTVEAGDFSIGGGAQLNLGGGENTVEFNSGTTRIAGDLIYQGGSGGDHLRTNGRSFTVTKSALFQMGDGTNEVEFHSRQGNWGAKTQYIGGSGADTFTFQGSLRAGTVTANFGSGHATMNFDVALLTLGSLAISAPTLAGETAALTVEAGDASLKTTGTFVTGAGAHTIEVGGSSFSAGKDLVYQGGSGSDSFRVIGSELRLAKVKMDASSGDSLLEITSSQLAATGIQFRGTEGTDTIKIQAHQGTSGLIDVQTGNGAATLLVSGRNDQLRVAGVNFTSTEASVGAEAELTRLFLAGALNLTTGAADDEILLHDNIVSGLAMIQTGGGNDTLHVDPTDTGIASSFRGVVTVQLGAGDDTFLTGNNTFGGRAIFAKAVTIDGGDGTDSVGLVGLALHGNTFKGGAPAVTNSETVT